MRNVAHVKSVNSKSVNPNDVEGAALALAALYFIQPDLMEEDEDEYVRLVEQIYEECCPLFRVPDAMQTPEESEAIDTMVDAIISKANKLEEKLRSSKDPLLRALAGRQRTTAE